MISKCLLVLAIVSQISAFKYNDDSVSYVKPEQSIPNNNLKFSYQTAPAKPKYQRIVTSPVFKAPVTGLPSQNQNVRTATSPITRNLIARGKYPVTLQNCGPVPDKKIPVVTSHVRAPVQEKPTVRLQTKIPAPKIIAHSCTCFKTIVKPRVQQHLITVPTIQRYIETMHRPVVENIHYEAYPIKCLKSINDEDSEEKDKDQVYQVQSEESENLSSQTKSSKIQTVEFSTAHGFDLPKIETEKAQLIELPKMQFVEEKKLQNIEIPHVQFIQNKKPQTVEIPQGIELPRVQFIQSQKSEAFEIPQTQFLENKKPQIIEIPNAQFVENNKAETMELPRLEFFQAGKLQTVEIPQIQVEEPPKVQTVEIPQGGTITLGTSPFSYQFTQ